MLGKVHLGGVIDSHLHLSPFPPTDRAVENSTTDGSVERPSQPRSAATAVNELLLEMSAAGIGHAVVLHLLWQPWSVNEVADALLKTPVLTGFINIDPKSPTALCDVDQGICLGFRGVKLHPRLQNYRPDDPACVAVAQRAGELGIPVLLDCFPDGDWQMAGLNILQYATLAKQAPNTAVIVAHAGGHYCLDLLMLAKRIKNLWFDISYSLLYYRSPVVEMIFYAIESMRYERVLFGTDYPDRQLAVSVRQSLDLMDKFGVFGEAREKLLWKNASELLKLKPLA